MNAPKLYAKMSISNEEFLQWMRIKLIFTTRNCRCGGSINYRWKSGQNHPYWRYTKRDCRPELGYLVDTFFEGSHLSLKEVNSEFFRFFIEIIGFPSFFSLVSSKFCRKHFSRYATRQWYHNFGKFHCGLEKFFPWHLCGIFYSKSGRFLVVVKDFYVIYR